MSYEYVENVKYGVTVSFNYISICDVEDFTTYSVLLKFIYIVFLFFFGFTVFLRLVKPNTRHLTPKSFLPRKIAKMSKKVKEKMIKNRLVIRVRSHFINYQI